MDAEFQELIEGELALLNHALDVVLKIPRDAFYEYGSSIFPIVLIRQGRINEDDEIAIGAQDRFNLLCEAAPNVPRKAIESICLAYVCFEVAFGERNHEEKTPLMIAMNLLSVAQERGVALGAAGSDLHTLEVNRKMALSAAGVFGAFVKHAPARELKGWALKQAASMKGNDRAIAKKLSASIPKEFQDASKNHERLIYDALRDSRKPKKP